MPFFNVVVTCSIIDGSTGRKLHIHSHTQSEHKRYINDAHRILQSTEINIKQLESQCTPFKRHAYSCSRSHNTHDNDVRCCMTCTCENSWHCSWNVMSLPASAFHRLNTVLPICISDPWWKSSWKLGLWTDSSVSSSHVANKLNKWNIFEDLDANTY